MKKFSFVILFLIFSLLCLYNYFLKSSYRAHYITDDCQIAIDINHNEKISEDEFFTHQNIYNFCSENSLKKLEKYTGNLSEHEKLYFKILSKKYYEKIFLNSLVWFKDGKIYVNFADSEKLLLDKGLAIPVNSDNSEDSAKIIKIKNEAKDKEIVLFNKKSLKYHKINCEKGLSAKNKEYLFKNELPKKATACDFCHTVPVKLSKPLKENHTELTQQYADIKLFQEIGAGVYKPSDKCNNQMCRALLKEIDSAQKSIDIAAYDFHGQPALIKALQNSAKRGVAVRLVTDDGSIKDNPENVKIFSTFTDKIYTDVNPKKDSNRLMHNKFLVFDGQKVWTGSANLTDTGLSGFNANIAILINSPEIAQMYENEFQNFVNQKFHSAKTPSKTQKFQKYSVYFSPQDNVIQNQVIPEIRKAQKYIYMPVFIITHKQLAQELINAKKRKVDVKLIIDATSARNKYSQHTLLRQNGIPVKTENFAGKMHMKSVIIDDKTVFTGSMNFTKSGNTYNDENCLKIEDGNVAKVMKNVFNLVWSKIPEKYLTKDPAPESFESVGSCFDGVDNDFDEKIDTEDIACKAK